MVTIVQCDVKLLIFSDIHSDLQTLERLLQTEADYYFAAGDLCNWGRALDATGEVMKARADRVYVLPGNHESAEQVSAFCARFGFHDFHGRRMQVGRYHVAGLGYSSPTPFDTPGEYSEEEMSARLGRFAGLKPLVMICHAPPRGTGLDRVNDHLNAGSTAVRDFISAEQPDFFFCGHIHEAAGQSESIGRTTAVNVGKQGYLLQLD
jgi:Icc-related predicted phosphoesterase